METEDTLKVDWVGVLWFLSIAFGFSWSIWIGLRGLPFSVQAGVGMFGPALACLVVRLIRREGFADAGLNVSFRKFWSLYVAAYLLPIGLFCVGAAITLCLGIQKWALPIYLQVHQWWGFGGLFSNLVLSLTVGVVVTMLLTFGEEFGWRGYLLPRLAPLGEVWAAIVVGLVWGFWHAPIIILDKYEYGTGSWLGVLLFVLFSVGVSFVFAWLRFRSGSIWPTVLAHSVVNTAGSILLLVFLTPGDLYQGAPVGVVEIVVLVAASVWLIATGRLRVQPAK